MNVPRFGKRWSAVILFVAAGETAGLAQPALANATVNPPPTAPGEVANSASWAGCVLFPANQARDVNPDTLFTILFNADVSVGSAGQIEICDAADDSVRETIDVAVPVATKEIGGLPNFHYYPVLLDHHRAIISLPNRALQYGRTYYIKFATGIFNLAGKPLPGFSFRDDWRFSTRAVAPRSADRVVVATDGTGDFNTVQGARDSIAEGNRRPITIFVRRGLYREIIFFTAKHNLTIAGEDRRETVISYANNARFNADSGGNPFGPDAPHPSDASPKRGSIYRRGLFLAHHVDDLTITNLTLRNTTSPGGSQAEAIILNGTTTARAVLKDVDLYSYQDTLQINGQAYIKDCRIDGDVDFMWGTGPCYFEDCTLRSLRSGAYYTQIRNPPANHGFIYNRCIFTGLPGVAGNYLSRIAPARFPASEVVLLDCTLGPAVGEEAWQLQNTAGTKKPEIENIHFWEFNSHADDGRPIPSSLRMAGSRRLDAGKDAATISNYRDYKYVLGGWDPTSAPIFAKAAGGAAPGRP